MYENINCAFFPVLELLKHDPARLRSVRKVSMLLLLAKLLLGFLAYLHISREGIQRIKRFRHGMDSDTHTARRCNISSSPRRQIPPKNLWETAEISRSSHAPLLVYVRAQLRYRDEGRCKLI